MEAAVNGTADVWRERINAQRAGGQSIPAWCRQQGQPEPAFYWWRRRLGLSPKPAARRSPRRAAGPIKFTEVLVDRAAAALRLRLGGGRELVLPASMPVESVAKLVHAIEAQPSMIEAKTPGIGGVA